MLERRLLTTLMAFTICYKNSFTFGFTYVHMCKDEAAPVLNEDTLREIVQERQTLRASWSSAEEADASRIVK
jgi:hypothetical protein